MSTPIHRSEPMVSFAQPSGMVPRKIRSCDIFQKADIVTKRLQGAILENFRQIGITFSMQHRQFSPESPSEQQALKSYNHTITCFDFLSRIQLTSSADELVALASTWPENLTTQFWDCLEHHASAYLGPKSPSPDALFTINTLTILGLAKLFTKAEDQYKVSKNVFRNFSSNRLQDTQELVYLALKISDPASRIAFIERFFATPTSRKKAMLRLMNIIVSNVFDGTHLWKQDFPLLSCDAKQIEQLSNTLLRFKHKNIHELFKLLCNCHISCLGQLCELFSNYWDVKNNEEELAQLQLLQAVVRETPKNLHFSIVNTLKASFDRSDDSSPEDFKDTLLTLIEASKNASARTLSYHWIKNPVDVNALLSFVSSCSRCVLESLSLIALKLQDAKCILSLQAMLQPKDDEFSIHLSNLCQQETMQLQWIVSILSLLPQQSLSQATELLCRTAYHEPKTFQNNQLGLVYKAIKDFDSRYRIALVNGLMENRRYSTSHQAKHPYQCATLMDVLKRLSLLIEEQPHWRQK